MTGRLRFVAVVTVFVLASCTDAHERAKDPTLSGSTTTTGTGAMPSTTVPSTAQSPVTTRTPRDTSLFDTEILKLTFVPHVRSDMRTLITIAPYFVVATFVVDFSYGTYATDENRAEVDAATELVIDAAPLGASFAMFVGPSNKPDRWNTNGPQGWAYLHDDGRLSPVHSIDPDGNPSWWSTLDLPRLRALIDETAPR